MGNESCYLLYKTMYSAGYILNEFKSLDEATMYLRNIINNDTTYRMDSAKVLTGFELKVTSS